MSIAAANVASNVANKIGIRNLIVGTKTILIPTSVKAAHSVAQASMSLVYMNAEKNIQFYQQNQHTHKELWKDKKFKNSMDDQNESSSDDQSESEQRYADPQSVNKEYSQPVPMFKLNSDEIFSKLSDDINCQRQYLKPSEFAEFDCQWGIDPTGEFVRGEKSFKSCFKRIDGAEETIKKEIDHVKKVKVSEEKIEKLNLATDEHIGIEMMHLFVLDLLGRETPAARIFEVKAKEDFIHTKVVTRRTKVFCFVFLFFLNSFFAFFTILRGYSKGYDWQSLYNPNYYRNVVI